MSEIWDNYEVILTFLVIFLFGAITGLIFGIALVIHSDEKRQKRVRERERRRAAMRVVPFPKRAPRGDSCTQGGVE